MSNPASRETVRQIAVDLIRPSPHQVRRQFAPEALQELARSIHESGVVQPVVVRPLGQGYELLAGERRWRAAQLAGLDRIPALLREDIDDDEAFVLGLIENLQRESLTPIEAAEGLRGLGERFGLTHEDIGRRICKSREYVSNSLRLLQLAAPVRALVNEGRLSAGHAKVLVGLAPGHQAGWAEACVRGNWSVRLLERRIAAAGGGDTGRPPETAPEAETRRLERTLAEQLGYPVELIADERGRGELRLRFHSLEELDGLLERIGCRAP